jgi:2-keto-4-pentenoate hydratase/2-oxohepta-3-ene-1,7-dioic acid hydratase in catechol pathway
MRMSKLIFYHCQSMELSESSWVRSRIGTAMAEPIFHLGTFDIGGVIAIGMVVADAVTDLRLACARAGVPLPRIENLADLLGDWDRNFELLQGVAAHATMGEECVDVACTRPLPPLGRRGKMLYAAANYRDHAAGMRKTFTPDIPLAGADKPLPALRPYMFGKVCEPTGAYDDIILPAGIERMDWEAEMMVVIGRPGRNIAHGRVKDHIAGYMTTNDVSCRDRTWREDRPALRSDWLSGKSFDSFAPIGPYFTPAAFVPDHRNVRIRLWVNAILKQDGNSGDMIFGVEEQVEYVSEIMTLLPGDMIATGTPAGTGQERLEFLKPGDVVETEVEFCGRQRNQVKVMSSAGTADLPGQTERLRHGA